MPSIEVEFEVWCSKCGAGLCLNVTPRQSRGYGSQTPGVDIEPCEKCLENAREEGYQEGFDEGKAEAE